MNKITCGQVKQVFLSKENTPCPITEKLVKAGYQQSNNGYISNARKAGLKISYKDNLPSQYWHLMKSYLSTQIPSHAFSKNIKCGELILWMAEVSDSIDKNDLNNLVDEIINNPSSVKNGRPIYDRIKWNMEIQKKCFDKIAERVIELSK